VREKLEINGGAVATGAVDIDVEEDEAYLNEDE
jgi:hypothetical protein